MKSEEIDKILIDNGIEYRETDRETAVRSARETAEMLVEMGYGTMKDYEDIITKKDD